MSDTKVFDGTPKEFAAKVLGLTVKEGRGRMSTEVRAAVDKALADGWTITGGSKPAAPKAPKPAAAPKPSDVFGKAKPAAPAPPKAKAPAYDAAAVRAWAAGQGVEVGARGRIPTTVLEAYAEAHQDGTGVEAKPSTGIANEAPRVYPSETRFVVDPTLTRGKMVLVGDRVACGPGGVSLSHCGGRHDGPHLVVAQGFRDLVPVTVR